MNPTIAIDVEADRNRQEFDDGPIRTQKNGVRMI